MTHQTLNNVNHSFGKDFLFFSSSSCFSSHYWIDRRRFI